MRSLLLIAVIFIYLCTAETWADEPGRVRVLSYNIHHAKGVDGKLDLERIAQVIRDADPDFVALQEVDRNTKRTNNVDQAQQLAELTGMHHVFGPNIELQGGQYGNAILSRWPIVQHHNHRLPCLNDGEQRGAIDAVIESPHGPIRLLATHLDHRSDSAERMASVKLLSLDDESTPKAMRAEGLNEIPALLAGDLNADWDSDVFREVLQHWSVPHKQALPTIPVDVPKRQIDFILYRPAGAWRGIDTKVLAESVASDHRPILTTLQLLAPDSSVQKSDDR